jgi:hypothetical protein
MQKILLNTLLSYNAHATAGALTFEHQHKHGRDAAHAVGRAAKLLLHVCNGATSRSLTKKSACAIAARAPNRDFDCIRRNKGRCAAGGGGRRLHSKIAISGAARTGERREVSTQYK